MQGNEESKVRTRTSALGGIKIAKLKGTENYQVWKFQVENLLRHEHLWTCANPPKDAEGNLILTDVKPEDDEDARTTINLLLEPQCIVHVKNAKTARNAWSNLSKQYENKCWSRRINLQTELWKLSYKECANMRDYLDKIKSLTQQLADIDAPVEDSWLVSIIMRGLPKQFDSIVQILDNTKEKVTSEDIMEKLMHESLRQQTRDNTQATSALKTALAQNIQSRRSSSLRVQVLSEHKVILPLKCFKCGGVGHKASDCKKSKEGLKNSKDNAKTQDKKQQDSESKKGGNWALSTKLTTMSTEINSDEVWMLDNCSSAHMTMREDWFNDLDASTPSKGVTCADNAIVPTNGTGNVNEPRNTLGHNNWRRGWDEDSSITREEDTSQLAQGSTGNGKYEADIFSL
ncbi:uncharacterized protein [Temnothorax nylanderi]|uniref:uncharacterized protein n=1 Tax=Temnothorax nylanderi TaxID=102681 RepID=UPI003A8C8198